MDKLHLSFIKLKMNKASAILWIYVFNFCCLNNIQAQSTQMSTYCNPLNLDYTYMIYNAHNDLSYRSGADPAVVAFRGEYYMFVTRSMGYWHSTDLHHWTFITPEKWYFEGSNAPAAHNYKDSVLYVTGNPSGSMSIHRYVIEGSTDGENWITLVDKRNSYQDTPNDYVELGAPQRVRYVRYKNVRVPTPHLSISDLRVFGLGQGKAPKKVKNLKVTRYEDRRDALLTWDQQENCQGYNVLWGIAPDKLYSSWLVYEKNSLELKSLTVDQEYYFAVEAFNENGISERTEVIKCE